ncbi:MULTISPECIES: IclR family transcriptional regulator [Parabacteroides]|jgi:DNA-binding IclR family transcriptional regulator|uniref:IclR family transcriptional regulator n=1 Tax=Parabacteroides TaxID=375288 RepID=UPI000EFDEFA8|nr:MULTISPECIES: IclR family transcriptional regulator [Parabacteroides]RHU22270.1 IclR family transcriptional regulator [Parabacteroides sp. TM07-1AC]WFE86535.1 IclR family transcriptional regulator [Parabacteroides chongii]
MVTQIEIEEKNTAKYNIPMLEKSFELLEFLVNYPSGLPMQEIVNLLDTPKTTIYRLLNSLQSMGYLTKDIDTQRYFLSKRFLRLGLAALGESNIVEQSLAPMRALRDTIKESVMLGVFMENRVVLLEQVLGSHNFTFLLRPGTSFFLHASAPGKLFLAYLSDEEREKALQMIQYKTFNKRTISCEEQMRKEINHIKKVGYAVDLEEEMAGVHCIATPIFNQFGSIAATIWTSGPSGRLEKKKFPEISKELIRTADIISANLGYIHK